LQKPKNGARISLIVEVTGIWPRSVRERPTAFYDKMRGGNLITIREAVILKHTGSYGQRRIKKNLVKL
jgi:hypothetical protein